MDIPNSFPCLGPVQYPDLLTFHLLSAGLPLCLLPERSLSSWTDGLSSVVPRAADLDGLWIFSDSEDDEDNARRHRESFVSFVYPREWPFEWHSYLCPSHVEVLSVLHYSRHCKGEDTQPLIRKSDHGAGAAEVRLDAMAVGRPSNLSVLSAFGALFGIRFS
jgi:hypothetical protein